MVTRNQAALLLIVLGLVALAFGCVAPGTQGALNLQDGPTLIAIRGIYYLLIAATVIFGLTAMECPLCEPLLKKAH